MMDKKIIEEIKKGEQIRGNLLSLKGMIKDEKSKRQLAYELGGDYSIFVRLIQDKDPKIRRNSAIIMGELEDDDLLPVLYEAYRTEKTLYIRADLLKAVSKYDYGKYMESLHRRMLELERLLETDKENTKHYEDELKVIKSFLYRSETCKHSFIGGARRTQLYLTFYPGCADIPVQALKNMGKRLAVAGSGVMVYDTCIDELQDLRLYKELLIPVLLDEPYDSSSMLIKAIRDSGLMTILRQFFDGTFPFLYRIQLKGVQDEASGNRLIKELAAMLEKSFPNDLVNSVGDYQIELRVIRKNENRFAFYLKPNLLKDKRFDYRKSGTSEAMKPVLAANMCEYCSKYFKDDAVVLDPFCGSGILLIERNMKKLTRESTGTDLLDLAISALKNNVSQTPYPIHAICKNFFEFENTSGEMADEIITDLPRVSGKRNEAYIYKLYRKFLQRALLFVKKGGYLFLYTNLEKAIKENMDSNDYELIEEKPLKVKDGFCFLILRVK